MDKPEPKLRGHSPPAKCVSPRPPTRAELARLPDRRYYERKLKGVKA